MKHMEIEENSEIVDPLQKAFTPPMTSGIPATASKSASMMHKEVKMNDFSPISESSVSDDDDEKIKMMKMMKMVMLKLMFLFVKTLKFNEICQR